MRDALLQDVRYALRHLQRAPGFSFVAILTLALGVGANAALFSLLNALVLRPLPVTEPHRLVVVSRMNQRGQVRSIPLTTVAELMRHQRVLEEALSGYSCCGMFPTEANGAVSASPVEFVDGHFYPMLGVRPFLGRLISAEDVPEAAIVNASLARRLFPSGNAIGRRIRLGTDPKLRALEIVGVVGDANYGNLRASHVPIVFRSWLQGGAYARYPIVEIRTSVEPKALGDDVRRTVASLGREYLLNLRTLDEQMSSSLARERVTAALSSFFAGLAVLMASIGLYGLLASAVARRTREIGVRMALGASRPAVLRMVVREGLVLTLLGVAVGVPCALGVGRLTGALLFNLAPSDPLTLIGAAGFFVIVGAVAGLLPARRASSLDPMAALRCE